MDLTLCSPLLDSKSIIDIGHSNDWCAKKKDGYIDFDYAHKFMRQAVQDAVITFGCIFRFRFKFPKDVIVHIAQNYIRYNNNKWWDTSNELWNRYYYTRGDGCYWCHKSLVCTSWASCCLEIKYFRDMCFYNQKTGRLMCCKCFVVPNSIRQYRSDMDLLRLLGNSAPRDIRRMIYQHYDDDRQSRLIITERSRVQRLPYEFYGDIFYREYPYTTTKSCFRHPHIQLTSTHHSSVSATIQMCQLCTISDVLAMRSGTIRFPFE